MMPLVELWHAICLVGIITIIIIIIDTTSQASATVGRQLCMGEKQHRVKSVLLTILHIYIAD
jgi:hypothetical protein